MTVEHAAKFAEQGVCGGQRYTDGDTQEPALIELVELAQLSGWIA